MLHPTLKLRLAAAALVLTTAGAWAAGTRLRADRNAQTRRELLRLEKQWSDAFNTGDAATLNRLLADDFRFTDGTGKVTGKGQYIDFVVNHIRVTSGGISNVTVHTYGDAGVVLAKFEGTEEIDGKPIDAAFRFTDVWVKRHGRWYAIASQDTNLAE